MLTLAIQSAGRRISVALLSDNRPLSSVDSDHDFRPSADPAPEVPALTQPASRAFPPGASVMLVPLIQTCLERAGLGLDQVQLIAVSQGPGMFTSLRVGVVTAKMLAYALDKPLVAVNTLAASAVQLAHRLKLAVGTEIQVALNAQRRQLFAATFRVQESERVAPVGESRILDREAWLAQLSPGQWITGSGLGPLSESLAKLDGIRVAAPADWDLTAETVGRCALQAAATNSWTDPWTLEPLYFRPSAAEEVRQATGGGTAGEA